MKAFLELFRNHIKTSDNTDLRKTESSILMEIRPAESLLILVPVPKSTNFFLP